MNPSAAAWAAILATACLGAGCRALSGAALVARNETVAPADTPAGGEAAPAPRTLPVDVHFVRHDPADPAFGVELWNHVDEQALDADLRRRLAANGLRAGVSSGRLPADVAAKLEPASTLDPSAPEHGGLRRRLQLLPGKRAEVVASTGIPELALLERDGEGVRGATYRDATAIFALQAWPEADGQVRVRVVPEVKHGAVQRSWVGEEGMFRLETGQPRRRFDELDVSVRLPVGGTLLVGVVEEPGAAVGDALLREPDAAGGVRLLVVRPQAATADPMFTTTDSADVDADDGVVDER